MLAWPVRHSTYRTVRSTQHEAALRYPLMWLYESHPIITITIIHISHIFGPPGTCILHTARNTACPEMSSLSNQFLVFFNLHFSSASAPASSSPVPLVLSASSTFHCRTRAYDAQALFSILYSPWLYFLGVSKWFYFPIHISIPNPCGAPGSSCTPPANHVPFTTGGTLDGTTCSWTQPRLPMPEPGLTYTHLARSCVYGLCLFISFLLRGLSFWVRVSQVPKQVALSNHTRWGLAVLEYHGILIQYLKLPLLRLHTFHFPDCVARSTPFPNRRLW